eukprot:397562-Karenia_brevis.AAC.1
MRRKLRGREGGHMGMGDQDSGGSSSSNSGNEQRGGTESNTESSGPREKLEELLKQRRGREE